MHTIHPQGEVRPSTTPASSSRDRSHGDTSVPRLRLRDRDRRVILPEQCLVRDCPVCAWRRAGLLDAPSVVRETGPAGYCPGCNRYFCACPSDAALAGLEEATYVLGFDHGTADGPENRPTRRWLLDAGLDPAPYLDGYDDACTGAGSDLSCELTNVNSVALGGAATGPLWDPDEDDGLPF